MSLRRIGAFGFCSLWLCLSVASSLAQERRGNGPLQPIASTVTLTAQNMPLTQVLAEIARQTGIAVDNQIGDPDPKVSLELRNEPFWKALDSLADRVNARVSILPSGGRIVLGKRGTEQRRPIVSYSGPFRFCVKRTTAEWNLDSDYRAYNAEVEVAWGPGLYPLLLESYPQDVLAIDNKGGRHPVLAGGKSMNAVDGSIAQIVKVPLPSLPRSTTSLARLDGRLEAIAPSKMLRFDFSKLVKGAASTQDGVTCKITDLILKDRWIVQVSIENPPDGGEAILESYQPWDTNNALVLVSKDGKTRLAAKLYVRESQSPRRAVLSYHFTDRARLAQLQPAECSLEYLTPARIVTVPLAFSFQDVPLP